MGGTNRNTAEATVPLTNQPNTYGRHINLSRRDQHRSSNPSVAAASNTASIASAAGMSEHKVLNTLPDGTALFVYDLKGDPLISRYGGIDKSKVPPYHRAGRGRILGSKGHLIIHHDNSTGSFSIQFGSSRDSARQGHNHPLARAAHIKSKPVKVRPASISDLVFDQSQDFISLNSSQKRKRKGNEHKDKDVSSEDEGPNYRSVEGKAKEHEFSDSDLDYSSDSSAGFQRFLDSDPVIQKNRELKRHLDEHPDDSNAWLERVSLQDDVLRATKDGVTELTEAEKKSQSEIKVDMLQKALKHIKPENQLNLQVALMTEGMKIWDKTRIAKKWKELSRDGDNNLEFFKLRLKSLLTSSNEFVYENIKDVFVSHISSLNDRIAKVQPNTPAHDDAPDDKTIPHYEHLLYVFLRATRFIHDSGYTELAVAAWQAALELHFCRPPDQPHLSTPVAKNRFLDFWESEVARIGEGDAKGWKVFAESPSQQEPLETTAEEEPNFTATSDSYKAWVVRERHHTRSSKMPIRLLNLREGHDYDPFKLVLFEDIEPFLFYIPDTLLPTMRKELLDGFLIFCGLPPAFADSDNIQRALQDPFLMSGLHDLKKPLLDEALPSLEPKEVGRKRPVFNQTGANYVPSLQVLFPGQNWFQYLPSWKSIHGSSEWAVDYAWALGVVRQLVCFHQVHELAEYYLALECAQDPLKAKSVAKTLLRAFPSNIGLYNAYVLAEFANGKPEIAGKVVGLATNLEVNDKLMLYYTWAWMDLERGKNAAILRLCQGVNAAEGSFQPEGPSPSLILKTKQTLSSTKDHLLSSGSHSAGVENALVLVLIDYLAIPSRGGDDSSPTQGNMPVALTTMQKFNTAFLEQYPAPSVPEAQSHQRFLQECCRLLYYHATHGPYRPADLREALVSFSKMYPTNTLLLSMVAWADSAVAASNPLRAGAIRDILETHSFRLSHDCPTVRIFAIRHASTISPHAARAAFESAFESGVCAGANALWRAYIGFVASHSVFRPRRPRKKKKPRREAAKQLRNEVARSTYYRAVNACPGVKGVVMEAFESLQGQMDPDELTETGREIVRWGVRISVDLEDFVAELRD